jgi:hypothetical protein
VLKLPIYYGTWLQVKLKSCYVVKNSYMIFNLKVTKTLKLLQVIIYHMIDHSRHYEEKCVTMITIREHTLENMMTSFFLVGIPQQCINKEKRISKPNQLINMMQLMTN